MVLTAAAAFGAVDLLTWIKTRKPKALLPEGAAAAPAATPVSEQVSVYDTLLGVCFSGYYYLYMTVSVLTGAGRVPNAAGCTCC
jgi:hypothetical protein